MKDEMYKLVLKELKKDNFLNIFNFYVEDVLGNKKLYLKFDCSDFKLEEINVKMDDRNLVVYVKYEEDFKG